MRQGRVGDAVETGFGNCDILAIEGYDGRKPMKRLTMILLLVPSLLSGCQGRFIKYDPDEKERIPVGSMLVLKQDVTIPAHKASIEIQGGQTRSWHDVDQYYTYCSLEIRKPSDSGVTIKAGKFRIIRIRREEEWVRQDTRPRSRYARLDVDDSDVIEHKVIFYLASRDQPTVELMSCGHWSYSDEGKYPTIREIRKALGDLVILPAGVR